ncbi:MAG: N-acetylmuramoyl-L-alanine amidase, partial [Clostridia bacterium]|nr:N-acetylmuramoyl-L-alanine amidase [Clostridia bacterium]
FTLSSYLKADLEEYSNVIVYTTRETIKDDCALADRGKLAAENGSELFISMHSNWAQSSEAMGVSVYRSFLRPESDELGALLGAAVTDVINGVTGETYMRNDGHPMIRTEPAYGEEYGDGVTQDYYNVTRSSVMSEKCRYSYIIEHGFHSNPKECAFLLSDENLQDIAAAECEVIAEYFGLYKDGGQPTGERHVQYDEIPPLSELGPVVYDLPGGMTMDASAAFCNGTAVTVRQSDGTAPGGYETLYSYELSASFFDCAVQPHGPIEVSMQTVGGADRIALYYKDKNGVTEVPFTVADGAAHATLDRCGTYFIVRLPSGLKGDVDGDGDVSNKDVVALFRYVSGAPVAVDGTAVDFNGDGSADNRDVTDLFKYVSKS